ncbi:DUF5983 family protein [Marinobacter salarius]|uniref:DUF5983 domain-containing protein n=1 Tax=Marinobacter salarius TaxID=1420917 RepID=A0A1W6KFR6_9GAMM|nr:hypothetical protein [Marinobacter salarius]ARM86169.1 hypothetical protein MARSALSMR5_04149 [Marinobacter salarius]
MTRTTGFKQFQATRKASALADLIADGNEPAATYAGVAPKAAVNSSFEFKTAQGREVLAYSLASSADYPNLFIDVLADDSYHLLAGSYERTVHREQDLESLELELYELGLHDYVNGDNKVSEPVAPGPVMSEDPEEQLKAANDAFNVDGEMVETYRSVAISTAHLTQEDEIFLEEQAHDAGCNRVTGRESGYFIKLSAHEAEDNLRHVISEEAKKILRWAVMADFHLIEFDNAASEVDGFPTFDWVIG